jgi:hypothetical protein
MRKKTAQTFVAHKRMEIVAFTICVNYDDILKHMLDQNARFFKKWYIVTTPTDTKTIALIESAAKPNIEILFYDKFYTRAVFNKGGAQRFAQEHIHAHHESANILCIDADIYLPDDFLTKLPESLAKDTLYGAQRDDYWTLEDFLETKNRHPKVENYFQGYFQLYKQDRKYAFKDSYNCSKCDDVFRDSFPKKIQLDVHVKHLGMNGKHWNGRNYTYGVF